MRQFLLLLFSLGSFTISNAQYLSPRNKVWVFGDHAGLDFNNPGLNPVPIETNIMAAEGCASISDQNGNLLFYSNGADVWNSMHVTMPNGSNLLPADDLSSSTQAAAIVPLPGSTSKYLLFSLTALGTSGFNPGYLYYSVIDMDLDGGLGDVVAGQRVIPLDSALSEKMTVVLGDNCNIWLLVHTKGNGDFFKAFEITESGINPNAIISPGGGTYIFSLDNWLGCIKISPNREKVVIADAYGYSGLRLYDFDAASGAVSNPLVLDTLQYYGVCFSPDNSKLYASRSLGLYQYDLNSPNPEATKLLIDTAAKDGDMKIGPDGRIYKMNILEGISVILSPNVAGTACQYQSLYDNADFPWVSFPARFGLPNDIAELLIDTMQNTFQPQSCFFELLEASDLSGNNYLWNDGSSGPSRQVDNPGTYWVSYRTFSPCIFHIDTFKVLLSYGVLPKIGIIPSCSNDANGKAYAYTYPSDTVTYRYIWRNGNNDTLALSDTLSQVPAGGYTLQVVTAHCDTTLPFSIPEESHHVSFSADSILCEGGVLILNNTSDTHFTDFKWTFGDGDSSTIWQPTHVFTQPGQYEITLVGAGSICTDTASRKLAVDARLSGSFTLSSDSVCIGQRITFYTQTDSSILSQYWSFGDGSAGSYTNEPIVEHAYDHADALPVTLTVNYRACPDTIITGSVYIDELPVVFLGPDTGICLHGTPVFLRNLVSQPGGAYRQRWNTGDTTAMIQIVHPGNYSLTVSNALGCSTTETVTVHKDCYIDIPNVFTPDGDGINDYFFPRQWLSRKVTAFNMHVFNRWGRVVFETKRPDGRGWDGRLNDREQPQGVYVYLIEVEFDNGLQEHYQGNVTLLR